MDDPKEINGLRLQALEDFLPAIWLRLKDLESSILDIKRGIEHMTIREVEKPIKQTLLVYQVASLAEGQTELEDRVKTLESQVNRLFALLRAVGIILLTFASVFVANLFF